jgi:hypothetical protein
VLRYVRSVTGVASPLLGQDSITSRLSICVSLRSHDTVEHQHISLLCVRSYHHDGSIRNEWHGSYMGGDWVRKRRWLYNVTDISLFNSSVAVQPLVCVLLSFCNNLPNFSQNIDAVHYKKSRYTKICRWIWLSIRISSFESRSASAPFAATILTPTFLLARDFLTLLGV